MSSPIPAAYRLLPAHRTIERTGLTRPHSRRPNDPEALHRGVRQGVPLRTSWWRRTCLSCSSAAEGRPVSPGLPSPMARPGCRRAPARNGTDPRGLPAGGTARTACPRPPFGQRGGLLPRARLPQLAQQVGHAVRVAEGGVGGGPGPAARRPALARPPPAGCAAGWPRRPGRRGRRGRPGPGPAARRPAPARPPPAGCAAGRPRGRVAEGGVGGGAGGQRGGLLVCGHRPGNSPPSR